MKLYRKQWTINYFEVFIVEDWTYENLVFVERA